MNMDSVVVSKIVPELLQHLETKPGSYVEFDLIQRLNDYLRALPSHGRTIDKKEATKLRKRIAN